MRVLVRFLIVWINENTAYLFHHMSHFAQVLGYNIDMDAKPAINAVDNFLDSLHTRHRRWIPKHTGSAVGGLGHQNIIVLFIVTIVTITEIV